MLGSDRIGAKRVDWRWHKATLHAKASAFYEAGPGDPQKVLKSEYDKIRFTLKEQNSAEAEMK